MSGNDDFEEKLIEQITEMFRNMGMNLDKEQIRALMEQFRAQFENLGLDAEKIAKGDVNFNFDLSQLAKMFEKGKSMEDILQNMGIDVQVDANPIQVETPEIDEANDELYSLPADDVYLDGWNMSVTIDFTLKGDVDAAEVELSLIRGGQQLEIMKSTQTSPLARVPLPHPCDDVVDWSLNNGILDVTLKLTPQGSAVEQEDDGDDDEGDDGESINNGTINLDYGASGGNGNNGAFRMNIGSGQSFTNSNGASVTVIGSNGNPGGLIQSDNTTVTNNGTFTIGGNGTTQKAIRYYDTADGQTLINTGTITQSGSTDAILNEGTNAESLIQEQ